MTRYCDVEVITLIRARKLPWLKVDSPFVATMSRSSLTTVLFGLSMKLLLGLVISDNSDQDIQTQEHKMTLATGLSTSCTSGYLGTHVPVIV